MIYTNQDYLMLERMDDDTLESAIESARVAYNDVLVYFDQLEKDSAEKSTLPSLLPSLDILFSQLKNIEGYIRKAENLLNIYDDGRYIQKMIKNREKNLSKVKKSLTKKKVKLITLN